VTQLLVSTPGLSRLTRIGILFPAVQTPALHPLKIEGYPPGSPLARSRIDELATVNCGPPVVVMHSGTVEFHSSFCTSYAPRSTGTSGQPACPHNLATAGTCAGIAAAREVRAVRAASALCTEQPAAITTTSVITTDHVMRFGRLQLTSAFTSRAALTVHTSLRRAARELLVIV
jgi:hypothetical protein